MNECNHRETDRISRLKQDFAPGRVSDAHVECVGRDNLVGVDPRVDLEAEELPGGAAADGSRPDASARDAVHCAAFRRANLKDGEYGIRAMQPGYQFIDRIHPLVHYYVGRYFYPRTS